MNALVCNKCSTTNKEGADKCSTCGFPFSNNKMTTVGKYLGEFAPKPTILDSEVSGAFYQKPTFSEEAPFSQPNKETIFENNFSEKPSGLNQNQDNLKEFTAQNNDTNDVIGHDIPESTHSQMEEQIFPHDVPPASETEGMNQETIASPADSSDINENICIKCDYILSDYSTICPSCGHNNVKASVTIQMPINDKSSDHIPNISDKTITEPNPQHVTGAFPFVPKPKDPAKTISEHQDQDIISTIEGSPFDNPYVTQRHEKANSNNKTIREGYNSTDEDSYQEQIYNRHISSEQGPKSSVRLEAIYLGQDSDQKMTINIPEQTGLINITRGVVDEGDSTISSGVHATIYKEGDEWKIENKASNKAVFIQVNEISPLKNGDIIMLGGDKFYVFVDESNK